ncbi:MAG TPA: DUF1918 domain-containing protein [Gaiellaceae bacterium]|nr:DUF1918 domain-containing protein [Gaiellaceae bacterium]
METLELRRAEPGDIVETSGRHVGDKGRTGEIVAVLGDDEHPHYLVQWEDGRETILYPKEGTRVLPREPEAGWAD